ncbi:hypothetical protein HNY73_019571 [Argiope bruennichi]|uniref:Secreted protein n=1 Tax=Argiope bruennichi TaxID=94029 RepID=A0A8T0E547_ARGBR|nr:hypothetical protein HNY73_019571 [Argiope bruennichi]
MGWSRIGHARWRLSTSLCFPVQIISLSAEKCVLRVRRSGNPGGEDESAITRLKDGFLFVRDPIARYEDHPSKSRKKERGR